MCAAVFVLLAGPFAVAEEAPARPDRVPSFALPDQFNDEHAVTFPRSKPTVLVLADRRGSEQLDGWLKPLGERHAETVHIDGVADVRGVPGLMRWGVRQIFRRGSKTPILLDWEDTVCGPLAYEGGVANLIVIDRDGAIVHRVHGEATAAALATVNEVLETLLPSEEAGAEPHAE